MSFVAASQPSYNAAPVAATHDNFVFAPNCGQASATNFMPTTGNSTFHKSGFAGSETVAAAIHNDAAGHPVVTDAAHDMTTLQHVTSPVLLAHLTDFHIV